MIEKKKSWRTLCAAREKILLLNVFDSTIHLCCCFLGCLLAFSLCVWCFKYKDEAEDWRDQPNKLQIWLYDNWGTKCDYHLRQTKFSSFLLLPLMYSNRREIDACLKGCNVAVFCFFSHIVFWKNQRGSCFIFEIDCHRHSHWLQIESSVDWEQFRKNEWESKSRKQLRRRYKQLETWNLKATWSWTHNTS